MKKHITAIAALLLLVAQSVPAKTYPTLRALLNDNYASSGSKEGTWYKAHRDGKRVNYLTCASESVPDGSKETLLVMCPEKNTTASIISEGMTDIYQIRQSERGIEVINMAKNVDGEYLGMEMISPHKWGIKMVSLHLSDNKEAIDAEYNLSLLYDNALNSLAKWTDRINKADNDYEFNHLSIGKDKKPINGFYPLSIMLADEEGKPGRRYEVTYDPATGKYKIPEEANGGSPSY